MTLATLAFGVVAAHAGFSSFSKPRSFKVGEDPFGLAAGDFNQDGKIDLAVTDFQASQTEGITILKNRGHGKFKTAQAIPTPSQPDDIVVAPHVNGDRDPDLVVGGLNNGLMTLRGTKGARFAAPQVIPDTNTPRQVAAGDFNHDGLTDIAADRQTTSDIAVYLAQAGGGYAPPALYPGGAGVDISAFRVNGDSRPDLVVANPFVDKAVHVYLGRADGSFKPPNDVSAGPAPQSAARADVNHDHKTDLVVENATQSEGGLNRVAVAIGRGDGTFKQPRLFKLGRLGESQPNLAVADFDRDGHPDVVAPFEPQGKLVVLRGKPLGRLSAPRSIDVKGHPHSVIAARLNGDRRPDIAATTRPVADLPGHVAVLLKKK